MACAPAGGTGVAIIWLNGYFLDTRFLLRHAGCFLCSLTITQCSSGLLILSIHSFGKGSQTFQVEQNLEFGCVLAGKVHHNTFSVALLWFLEWQLIIFYLKIPTLSVKLEYPPSFGKKMKKKSHAYMGTVVAGWPWRSSSGLLYRVSFLISLFTSSCWRWTEQRYLQRCNTNFLGAAKRLTYSKHTNHSLEEGARAIACPCWSEWLRILLKSYPTIVETGCTWAVRFI